MRAKPPTIPVPSAETVRRRITDLLEERELCAREISIEAGIPEKAVYGHLEHIRRSLSRGPARLAVVFAECRKCGFVFAKRSRLTRPGKCPVCRGESITEPRFHIR